MKRNYLVPALGSAIGIGLLATGMMAYASAPWKEVLPAEESAHPSTVTHQMSPLAKHLRSLKGGDPSNTVNPGLEGMRTIPQSLRERKIKPAPVMRSPESPRGNLYGIVNRYVDMEFVYEAYLGSINPSTGKLTPMYYGRQYCPYNGEDYVYQSNSYRKGEVICTDNGSSDFLGSTESQGVWTTYDLATGEYVDTHVFRDPLSVGYTMTYDSDRDLFYVVAIDIVSSQGDGMFGIVKPNDNGEWKYYHGGKLETTDGTQPFIAAIAYNNNDKNVYAFDNNNYVYTIEWGDNINAPDATLVSAGEIMMEDDGILFDCPSYDPMNGQICYSPMDECFIAVYRDNSKQQNYLTFIHPETFEGTIGKKINAPSTPYITAIFCSDDYASSNAPMLSPKPVVSFDKANTSGQISFTTPTESFIGLDLTGETLKATAKIDGNVIDERDVKAGSSYTVDVTLEQGNHKLEFTTALGNEVSPVNSQVFYVGYDAPVPVKNIRLSGNTLTWDAPKDKGFNGGYVDVNDISYNVYLNDKIQNSEPIKTTSFVLTVPADMKVYQIAVEASSHNVASPKASINQIFGQAFTLPFMQTPTRSQFQNLYTVLDSNNDGWKFYWGQNTVGTNSYDGVIFQPGYTKDADDWLILPLINFPDASKLYTFDFDIRGVYTGKSTPESYEICLLKSPDPKGVVTTIFNTPNEDLMPSVPLHKAFTFAVPEAGDYYIAIHALCLRDAGSMGFTVHNLEVKSLEGASSAVPSDPTNVKVQAADFGEQAASVTATLPTKDILGNALDADDDITLTFSFTDGAGVEHKNTGTGKPGQTITVDNGADNDGFIVYTVTPSNKNGSGYTKAYRIYVGMDIPLCPSNIRGVPTDDNMGIMVEWDAPGNVGRNGGYVDTSAPDFKYTFYTQSGGLATSSSLQKITDTNDLAYTFYPYGEGNKGSLATFYMGPTAKNSVGQSVESLFLREDLGTPYELPMNEEWGSSKFDYSPYTFYTSGEYSKSQWENTNSVGNLPVGNPTFVKGALMGYSTEGRTKSKLVLPKFTTKGIKKSIFKLRYWDYQYAPSALRIYGRHSGFANGQDVLIGEFKLSNPKNGEWIDDELILPSDFNNCGWVQILVECTFSGSAQEYLFLDSFQVTDDADYDLKLLSLEGMTEATLGDDIEYTIVVANSGRERMDGNLKVEIIGADNKVLDSITEKIDMLAASQNSEFTANFHISYNEPSVIVRASVDSEDENLSNNVKELELAIKPSSIPVVNDLKAEQDDLTNTVKLSWSAPTTEYGNFENFEGYKPFAVSDSFDYWTNVNADDLWPIGFQNQSTGELATWENSTEKKGWQIYNYDMMKVPNDRLKPHSGKQALIAVCGNYDQESEPVQTSKWLISPVLVPGTSVSFWYSTFESSTTEYVEIWTCEKENGELNPNDRNINLGRAGDFRKISSKSKSGSEIWEYIKYTLGRREVKFALRYCSYDGFAAMIDDISFTPANMLTRTPESYSVYRCDQYGNNPVLVAENITDTHFTDNNWDGSACQYYVVSNNTVDGQLVSGPASNYVRISLSGVGEINDAQSVTAGKGQIFVNGFEGENVTIAAADGKIIVNAPVRTSNAAYIADKGVYLVTIGKRTFKVIVK